MEQHRKAIIWMILACLGASIMVAIIGHLTRAEPAMHPFQVVFLRNIFALIFFMPWIIKIWRRQNNFVHLKTTQIKLHAIRVVLGLIAMYFWFFSLAVVPHPTAVALSFTSPLITAVLAVFLLQDRFGWHKGVALVCGFVGAIVILRPGMEGFNQYGWMVLVAAALWSGVGIIIKRLTLKDSPQLVAFYMVLVGIPLTLPLAIIYWQPVSLVTWGWVLLLGFVSVEFQVAMNKAFSLAPFSVILPFDFTRLIFTSILSYFLFSELIDLWTFVGAVLIMASAVYATWRQAKKDKQAKQKKCSS